MARADQRAQKETARTFYTGGSFALEAESSAGGDMSSDRKTVGGSQHAKGAVAFKLPLREGSKNPGETQNKKQGSQRANQSGVHACGVKTGQMIGFGSGSGHVCGSLRSGQSVDGVGSAMAHVKKRRFQAQDHEGHANGGQGDIGHWNMVAGQAVGEGFKLGHVGRRFDKVAGHLFVPVSIKIFVNSGSIGKCFKFSTIWTGLGKRAVNANNVKGLDRVSRVDTAGISGQSTLTPPVWARKKGVQPC